MATAKRRTKRKPAPKRARRPSTLVPPGEPNNRQLQDLVASRGLRLVPINSITDTEQLEKRLDLLAVDAREAFEASKSSARAQKTLSDEIKPLLTDLKIALTDLTGRVAYLERSKSAHAVTLTEHHDRLTALETERAKGTP